MTNYECLIESAKIQYINMFLTSKELEMLD